MSDSNELKSDALLMRIRTEELEHEHEVVRELQDQLHKENIVLRRTEFFLSEGQRLAQMGSWAFDPKGLFDYWSPELFKIYGLNPSNTPPTLSEYLAVVHPEDRQFMADTIENMIATGSGCDVKKRIVRPDGVMRIIRCVGIPVFDNGMFTGFVGTAIDVTEQEELTRELRRRQAYLTKAQKLTHTGSFRWSVVSGEIFWSEQTYSIFEYDPELKPTLELLRQRIHPEDKERFRELIDRASHDGNDFETEYRLLFPNGSVKHLHVFAHALYDECGKLEYVGAVMEITQAREARASLEKAFKEIEVLKNQLYNENIALREEVDKTSMFEEIIGTSAGLQEVLSRVMKVAPTDSTVLITGETGTGKELIARAIHKKSRRSDRAFVTVNCAVIPQSLIASELFGHEKGAFTGAIQRRPGRFELAEGGTIFLDEIGELPLETQIALLRVLQEREFERVGGNQPIRVNVRVVAATNRDLKTLIAEGSFRSDLFYRLNVFPIVIPPLRERKEDIVVLAKYFIDRYANNLRKKLNSIDKRTLDLLQSYSWPGNVRELQNVIERSVIVCNTDRFVIDERWVSEESAISPPSSQIFSKEMMGHEKEMIEAALRETKGVISGLKGAAVKLGIPATTLDHKIKTLKINKYHFKSN